jgi:hypothetical protein
VTLPIGGLWVWDSAHDLLSCDQMPGILSLTFVDHLECRFVASVLFSMI